MNKSLIFSRNVEKAVEEAVNILLSVRSRREEIEQSPVMAESHPTEIKEMRIPTPINHKAVGGYLHRCRSSELKLYR
jgi:hypothetical protein